MYLHTRYTLTHGLAEAEGFHSLARVIVKGGKTELAEDHLPVSDADEFWC